MKRAVVCEKGWLLAGAARGSIIHHLRQKGRFQRKETLRQAKHDRPIMRMTEAQRWPGQPEVTGFQKETVWKIKSRPSARLMSQKNTKGG